MTESLAGGSTIRIWFDEIDGWPERPTSRADVIVWWCSLGGAPDPPIVLDGRKGMLNNVDIRSIQATKPRSEDEEHPMVRFLERLINEYKQKPGYYS